MSSLWAGLIDDAALFPPGNAPLEKAVPAHIAHHRAWYAQLVGPFISPVGRLDELARELGDDSCDVSVLLPEGPSQLAPAREFSERSVGPRVTAVELVVPPGLTGRQVVAALGEALPTDVRAYVELPRSASRNQLLQALEGTDHHAKLRTGGTRAAAFPDERELASWILGCVRRGVPFKCTAGLHNAVRHRDDATTLEHHGFLNIVLATSAALQGHRADTLAALLAQSDPGIVAEQCRRLGDDGIAQARAFFTSLGTCSVSDPLGDLISLGLVAEPAHPHHAESDAQ
ncbi:hypothetical protein [Streptomyces sp. HGB0020]|uniref:hypothetical protein n=1 Tax=Streptomyces sp. HGB0020 TaxID=1078086 RepID=UPI00034E58CD|nr:hypothetical protein [Streptomyces sp. HGB0020]EPD57778.1 hypothetical protein HMPREF1211_06116 [Streptomyces sp. HGB0020]